MFKPQPWFLCALHFTFDKYTSSHSYHMYLQTRRHYKCKVGSDTWIKMKSVRISLFVLPNILFNVYVTHVHVSWQQKLYNNGMLSSYKKSTDLSYEFVKNYCAQFSYQSISVQIATHHDLVHFWASLCAY